MATIDKYQIDIVVNGGDSLNQLEKNTNAAAKSVSNLNTVLTGIGAAAFIRSAYQMADAMNDTDV